MVGVLALIKNHPGRRVRTRMVRIDDINDDHADQDNIEDNQKNGF